MHPRSLSLDWVGLWENKILDDGRILGQYYIWVQDALTVTVVMFLRTGLDTNLEKT